MPSETRKFHLVYPHQLFQEIFSFSKNTTIVLIEDPLFFNDRNHPRNFHKQKIVLHRASLKSFASTLKEKGFDVMYFEFNQYPDPEHLSKVFVDQSNCEFTVFDPVDYILDRRLKKTFSQYSRFSILETPNFLTTQQIIKDFFGVKKSLLMNNFYIFQRKRLNILMDNDRPLGGKWSYDSENRKRLPKDINLPKEMIFQQNKFVKEAIEYVNTHFKENPGNAEDFNYPVDHNSAEKLLNNFLSEKLANFGAYEDAIAKNESILFHSNISSSLNIGLLSPSEIIKKALDKEKEIPLSSLEGFIRQIIGWREFMRGVYTMHGSTIRKKNFLNHKNKLPKSWYTATTGIEPIDSTIKKVLKFSYCHHIERLMILGNFMLLLQINPDDIYGWFMDLFIDSYDWVMVPNVYAMSQFADGGTITTKPYFSSSNYVLKMSDYKKGSWCEVWDSLFYLFLKKHRNIISKNPRLSVLIKNLDKISTDRLASMEEIAKKYII